MGKENTRPNGISARIVKKRSEANERPKKLHRVNFGIEQGGRQKFMLRWRFQDESVTGHMAMGRQPAPPVNIRFTKTGSEMGGEFTYHFQNGIHHNGFDHHSHAPPFAISGNFTCGECPNPPAILKRGTTQLQLIWGNGRCFVAT